MILDLAAQDPVELVGAGGRRSRSSLRARRRTGASTGLADCIGRAVGGITATTPSSGRPQAGLWLRLEALALLQGRGFVLPEDVKSLASQVLSHRLILTPTPGPAARAPEGLVTSALGPVPVPL